MPTPAGQGQWKVETCIKMFIIIIIVLQVADEYIGLDVLGSHMDVKSSNFRRVPGLPIYGVAQTSREVGWPISLFAFTI